MLSATLKAGLAWTGGTAFAETRFGSRGAVRAVNIMNFIRAEEPREKIDLFAPVREQMRLIKLHQLPATWLLQYDVLVEGPFVDFLKAEMPPTHETGLWFEMNRKICDDAGIAWRGRAAWEWDYHVPVAYAIGYTPEERRKLADTAMARFHSVFGHRCKTVASWNLDAASIAHLSDHYDIDAFGNCRDQLATDGFTIWGAPIAGYFPSRKNAWSPAVDRRNQIATPMFRLLGQDPVYYYDNQLPYPDTLEPVWESGRSPIFVDRFLQMTAKTVTGDFAYAQFGQENSFGWPQMKDAYPMQMEKLALLQRAGYASIETMGETGRRFKRHFHTTPTQAQVMLDDPFGESPAERTIWYQSRFHRANLHFRDDEFYLRDLHVYSDDFPQPYLTEPVQQHGIEQRLLAVLDGFHWSDDATRSGHPGQRAMGAFLEQAANGKAVRLRLSAPPRVSQLNNELQASLSLQQGGLLYILFREQEIEFQLRGRAGRLALHLGWVRERSAFCGLTPDRLNYRYRDFDYAVRLVNGKASARDGGAAILSHDQGMRVVLAQ